MKTSPNIPCPCGSGLKYKKCCLRFHKGMHAPDALALMKSRYSAYAVGDARYIVATTHPLCPEFDEDTARWKEEILAFSRHTRFEKLEIVAYDSGEEEAFVHFKAHLSSGVLEEKSRFVKENGRWYYREGKFD
jgi:SEC-C motif-containing protein